MPHGIEKVVIKRCEAVERDPHPCDEPKPCDSTFLGGICPEPFLCKERIKNPAWPGEITTCKGPFIYAKSCGKDPVPHPCDVEDPRSLQPGELLCYERIKNPEEKKKEEPLCEDCE